MQSEADVAAFVSDVAALVADVAAADAELAAAVADVAAAEALDAAALADVVAEAASTIKSHFALSVFVVSGCGPVNAFLLIILMIYQLLLEVVE